MTATRHGKASAQPVGFRAVSEHAPLDAVIISYRCEGLLRDCLRSLRDHPPSAGLIVRVVDNASGDGTAEMVRSEFPEVGLIVAPRNIGFGTANNVAIQGGTTPYVLCLNPDTRVTPGALDRLLELMEEHPEVGISGCRLELPNGRVDYAAKRSFPTPVSALGHFTGLGRRRDSGILAAYRAPEVESGPVDAVNGAFMLVRRSALDEVGLFDEGYWMYMEDLDLCYRFAQAGWVTWYEPSATVIHVKAGSSGRVRSPRLNYAFHYGMFRFYRKHYAATRSRLLSAAVYVGIAAKLVLSLARNALTDSTRARWPTCPAHSARRRG
jgi:N-acetylglucosaminyl-diphospho-decaprenol L-rhamnosyltransferase